LCHGSQPSCSNFGILRRNAIEQLQLLVQAVMPQQKSTSAGFYSVEEQNHGGTVWVAIRARGSDFSWLTREEAAEIGRQWAARYGAVADPARSLTIVSDRPERRARRA
jgi:hypothetical protein